MLKRTTLPWRPFSKPIRARGRQLRSPTYIIDGKSKHRTTSIPSQIPDGLTWETSRTIDGGIDLGFYNGKINISADYYVRNTLNMYTVGPSLPDTYGASSPKGNYADLVTRGFELSLSYNDSFKVGRHDLNVGFKATLADNRTFVTRYNNPTKSLSDYYEGQEIGEIWGFQFGGFFDTQDQIDNYYGEGVPYVNSLIQVHEGYLTKPGDVILIDRNGNHMVDKGSLTVDDPGDMVILIENRRRIYDFYISSLPSSGELPTGRVSALEQKFLRSIQEYVSANLHRNITLDDLAEVVCLSPSSLYKKMKEYADISPMEYVMKVRLHRAVELLKDDSLSVQEVAQAVGFNTHSFFSECFKREFGMTPRAWRLKGVPKSKNVK